MPRRASFGSVATLCIVTLVLLAPVVAIVSVPAAAIQPGESPSSYAVAQGTTCTEITPVTNASKNVSAFYDYRNPYPEYPDADTFSSYGTTEYQRSSESVLFAYAGSEGTSLVVLHDRLGDESGGSTVTFEFDGLPADGEWAVQDDDYLFQDDEWILGGTTATIHWKWGDNRTDGGAFRGLADMQSTISLDPGFNEDAEAWGDWIYSDTEDYRITDWTLLGANGTERSLDRDRRVFVHRGECLETAPSAAVAGPNATQTNTTETFDASDTTHEDGEVGGFEWDVDGDGDVDEVTTGPSVEHAFSDAGNHTVAVTAFDTYGNADTATIDVTVTEPAIPLTATLSVPGTATVNKSVTLDAGNSTPADDIVEYRWDVDSDDSAEYNTTEPTITHTYNATGNYDASVTVVNDTGATASDTTSIAIEPPDDPPSASLAGPTNVTAGEEATFDASNSTDDDGIDEYHWDVDGDGEIEAVTGDPNASHTYEEAGTYTATVTVVDSAGQNDSATHEITVEAAQTSLVANLSANATAIVNEPIEFNASGSTPAADIVEYRWDFDGEGGIDRTTTGPVVEYNYSEANDYDPSVTVVDDSDRTDEASVPVEVTANTTFEATIQVATETPTTGAPVEFEGVTSVDVSGGDDYEWNFGDGSAATGSQVQHTYSTNGTYEVRLSVTGSSGESATTRRNVTVERADDDGEDGDDSGGGSSGGNSGGGSSGGGSSGGGSSGGGSSGGGSSGGGPSGGGSPGGGSTGGGASAAAQPTTPAQPSIELENVSLSPRTPIEGETVSVTVTASNDGDAAGEKDVEFQVDGDLLETRTLALQPDETGRVQFTHQFTSAGNRSVTVDYDETRYVDVRPAVSNVSVVSLEARQNARAGEEFTVNATVTNTGVVDGSEQLELVMFDEPVAVKNVSVPVGEQRTVTFRQTVLSGGTYTASVGNTSVSISVADDDAQAAASPAQGTTATTATTTPGLGPLAVVLSLIVAAAGLLLGRD